MKQVVFSRFAVLLSIVLVGLAGGCASHPAIVVGERDVPPDARLSEAEAKKLMLDALDRSTWLAGHTLTSSTWGVTEFAVRNDAVVIRFTDASDGTIREGTLPFAQDVHLEGRWDLNELRDVFDIDGVGLSLRWYEKDDAVAFLKGYYAAKRIRMAKAAPVDVREIEAFQAGIVAQYHAANPKPVLPEEARRYAIQAADAAKGTRYEDAVAAYEKAFEVAPWWPEGHYNCALMHGALEQYGQAITEMRKYLLLVPDAPNARAAQDKIYVWEGRQGVK